MSPRLALLLAAVGCATSPTTREVSEISEVCVEGDELVVTFQDCLSSSCDTLLSATCSTEVAGNVITLTGLAKVEQEGGDCTADCGLVVARCPVPDVDDPATATLQFGGDQGGPTLADAACDAVP